MFSLVLIITLSLLLALNFSAGKLVRQMSRTIISARAAQVEAQLASYFGPIEIIIRAAENPVRTGQVSLLDQQQLNLFFGPLSSSVDQVAAVHACDSNGNYVSLEHNAAAWVNRTARPAKWPGRLSCTSRAELSAPATKEWMEPLEEDPRQSHWYKGASENQAPSSAPGDQTSTTKRTIHWTETYGFETATDPGITASQQIQPPQGAPVVLAIELLVSDLDEYTDNLHPTPNGYVVVTDLKGRLLEPVSSTEDGADEDAPVAAGAEVETRIPIETDESVMHDALTAWAKMQNAVWDERAGMVPAIATTGALPSEQEIFQFASRNQRWWGGLRSFQLGGKPEFYIAVLIPEADLLQTLHSQRQLLILIAAAALVLAAGLALTIAATFSSPIAALVEQSKLIRLLDLRLDLAPIDSRLKEVAQLSEAHASMRTALDSFARYVPRELVRDLLGRGEAARIGGRLLPLTILITDIRGFTAITESTPPEPLALQLAEYFDCILSALRNSGATIDKLVGDSVVAFWGAPNPVARQAESALTGALQALQDLRQANARWQQAGKPVLVTHAALTHGKVVVGNIGAHWRMNYTALGDAVNLASRLERLNPLYGTELLASTQMVEAAGPDLAWRLIDRVAVRGKLAPIEIFEPLGPQSQLAPAVLKFSRDYEAALRLVWDKHFTEAAALANALQAQHPAQRSVALLLERIEHYKKVPPAWNWDGVYRDAGHAADLGAGE